MSGPNLELKFDRPIALFEGSAQTGLHLARYNDKPGFQMPFVVLLLHWEDLTEDVGSHGRPCRANAGAATDMIFDPNINIRRVALAGIIETTARLKNPKGAFAKFFEWGRRNVTKENVDALVSQYSEEFPENKFKEKIADLIMAPPQGYEVFNDGGKYIAIKGDNLLDALERLYQMTKRQGFIDLKTAYTQFMTTGQPSSIRPFTLSLPPAFLRRES